MNLIKRDSAFLSANTTVTLSNCDREPIHTPSSIQPHGVLIVSQDGEEQIVYVSENSRELLGVDACFILQQTTSSFFGEKATAAIEASLLEEQLP